MNFNINLIKEYSSLSLIQKYIQINHKLSDLNNKLDTISDIEFFIKKTYYINQIKKLEFMKQSIKNECLKRSRKNIDFKDYYLKYLQ